MSFFIDIILPILFITFLILCGAEIIVALIDYKATITFNVFFKQKRKYKESRNKKPEAYGWFLPGTKLKEFPTITFNQFKDFYYLNPDSWNLYEYFVRKDRNNDMIMTFEWEEWKLYNKFYKQLEKEKESIQKNKENKKIIEKQNMITRNILESVQRDIDRIRNEQYKNIDTAAELIKGVKLQ